MCHMTLISNLGEVIVAKPSISVELYSQRHALDAMLQRLCLPEEDSLFVIETKLNVSHTTVYHVSSMHSNVFVLTATGKCNQSPLPQNLVRTNNRIQFSIKQVPTQNNVSKKSDGDQICCKNETLPP